MSDRQVRIFVSYSHRDQEYLAEDSLVGFLRGLEQDGVKFWTDERIAAGDKWDDEIRAKISQSDIALVLVSQGFLDSEYCTSVEIAGFLGRSREAGMVIIPVILSPCEWERHSWLCTTQYLPGHGETIEEHFLDAGIRKRLFLTIRSNLREQIESIRRAREESPTRAVSVQRPILGERRQITALECELTVLAGSSSMDPEEVAEVLPEFLSRATEILKRLDGHSAQRLGRRLLAYFGWPRVHEDDARRAVLAAREMVKLVKDLNRSTGGAEPGTLALKLAIHSGPMVFSAAPGTEDPMLVGDVPDVAAAIAGVAEPNQVYLSAAAHRLVEGAFSCAEAGAMEIKNLGQPLRLYVLEENDATGETGATTARPKRQFLVARDQELETLRDRWELAREATGQIVLIRGEAGIGKSRLVQEFRAEVDDTGVWLDCRCSPYHQNTEFYPLIDLLHRLLALVKPDQEMGEGERLEIVVRRLGMATETVVPLLAALLSVPLATAYPPTNLSPEGRKKNTLAAMLDIVLRQAQRQPVLLLVEDLHWIDASSRGFLDLLLEMQGTARILSLVTFRPDFDPAWRQLSYLSEISLRRLGSKEVATLISLLAAGSALPHEVVKEMVEKADGVPLFAEELTKMVIESAAARAVKGGHQPAAAGERLAVPATLEGSLMARLDRLGTAKEIAQVASAIGREFTYELLSQCVSADEAALKGDLDRLLKSEIILRRGMMADASYLFKHALIQQAAYQSILTRDARRLHGKIAEVLENNFPHLADTQPEVVALHLARAGVADKAIDYWQRAAERSLKNSANSEAVAHLTNALELLGRLPESVERKRREMRLRIALALPLIAIRGYAAAEVDEVLCRARDLCRETGEDTELFRVLRLLWAFHTVRGDHGKAHEAARQALAMAESEDAADLKLEADRVMGSSLFYLGRLDEARQRFERAIELYDRERDHSHVLTYGQDPGVSSLANEALTLWFLGYPDRAMARGAEALSLARELAHPYSLCYSLFFCSWLYVFLQDLPKLEASTEEMILLSRHQSFPFWETMGIIVRGWVAAQQGDPVGGLATMKSGIASWRRLPAGMFLPTYLCLVADIHARQGEVTAGLATVAEGFEVVAKSGEALCEPELYRLKGELLSMRTESSGGWREAEACLIRARETAAMQASKTLELRATVSLSRMWLAAGKREAAQRLLDETRQWFGEGSETHDLKRADELRAELGSEMGCAAAEASSDDRADCVL
jgi:class 3 adenylate cyclase/tetratricopeptide (TPR) repeat protein